MQGSMILNSQGFDYYLILISAICIILVFILFLISVYFITQKRHLKHQKDVATIKNSYQQALLQTRIEIQEETLKHVAREIHDNIGQVLSFVKLNLSPLKPLTDAEKQEKMDESKELVSHVINDLRNLSKSLSMDHFSSKGLQQMIIADAERLNSTGIFIVNTNIAGEAYALPAQHELILYRIFQESVNNCIKHSGAKNLKISLQYSNELIILTVEDDGSGFTPDDGAGEGGSGLKNMKSRAALIGAELTLQSSPGSGCRISVSLNPSQQQFYADGTRSSSPG